MKDKHDVLAQVRGLEDMNAGLMAENDSLKRSLRVSSGMPAVRFAGVNTWEGESKTIPTDSNRKENNCFNDNVVKFTNA